MDCSKAIQVKVNTSPVASLLVGPVTVPPTEVQYTPTSPMLTTPDTSPVATSVYTATLSYSDSTASQPLTTNKWKDFFENKDDTFCPVKASTCRLNNIALDCGAGSKYVGGTLESCPSIVTDIV